jgi:glycerophosphoryl diester phosphodiesterase
MTRWEPIRPRRDRPLIVAHRGTSGVAPENTMAAYHMAIDEGADILEIDVHLTSDGALVVHHDDTLERTTDVAQQFPDREPWMVRDFTVDEIRSLSAGEWDGERQAVPIFEEVVDLARERDVGLLVETKFEYAGPDLEPALAEAVRSYPDWEEWVPGRLMVCSFDLSSLQRARDAIPGTHLAYIVGFLVADDGVITQIGPLSQPIAAPGRTLEQLRDDLASEGIGYLGMALLGLNGQPSDDFTAETVEFFRAGGVEVNFITDEPEAMQRLIDRGVSSILTNHPRRLADMLGIIGDDDPRVSSRAELSQEEEVAGSADPEAQAAVILGESDQRVLDRDAAPDSRVEQRSSDDVVEP